MIKVDIRLVFILLAIGVFGHRLPAQSVRDWTLELIPLNLSLSNNYWQDGIIIDGDMDQYGLIWLYTGFGVVTFDGERYSIHPAFQDKKISYLTLNGRNIVCDSFDRVWIVTEDRGVIAYDWRSKAYIKYNQYENADVKLPTSHVYDIKIENDSSIWLTGGNYELYHINSKTNSLKIYDAQNAIRQVAPKASTDRYGNILIESKNIWIACRLGLTKFDRSTETFRLIPFEQDLLTGFLLPKNMALIRHGHHIIVAPLFENYSGLVVFDADKNKMVRHIQDRTLRIHQDVFLGICKWSDHELLAGAVRDGFMMVDLDDYHTERIFAASFDLGYSDIRNVLKIYRVSETVAYVLTHHGVMRLTDWKNPFKYFSLHDQTKQNWQRSFIEDERIDGYLIGTTYGSGILQVDMDKDDVIPIRYQSDAQSTNYDITFSDMYMVDRDEIWLGTSEGLLKLNYITRTIHPCEEPAIKTSELASAAIHEIIPFDEHAFGISTSAGAFYRYQMDKQVLSRIIVDAGWSTDEESILVSDLIRINDRTSLVSTTAGLRQVSRWLRHTGAHGYPYPAGGQFHRKCASAELYQIALHEKNRILNICDIRWCRII